ncbi:MAG: hypothetical protein H7Z10_02165 [Gemmatimonadaceae bacterium]|nr:hypothetical protein [Acetobacteraceae bacterium]
MTAWGLGVFAIGLAWVGLWRTRVRWAGVIAMLGGLLSPLTAPPPDILLSSEARLIAVRDGATYVQARSGASKFTRAAWQNHLAAGPLLPLQTGEPPSCGPETCRIERNGTVVLLLRGKSGAGDCTGVALVVSAEPAREECPGIPYVDRFSVWRNGAHAIWLTTAGPRILSDRAVRGDRPWVPGLPVPRRVVPNLPMAATDDLPPALED